ncbi:WecB/TagA/CpsF family glycosyltransferase [Treponema brennaborense]|uniref:Glycosyl transferase WecB/TagA/CpsF n=1 Tax=Treponema brennaborense (strain DSM 12168 / CIP 105900 / DD5/3) TaxID=906968 RepID=F4LL87_TREBD|nr:WecB/TagA/CpsF family glycosyltransferase [Treponema brennaborense]AEE17661.1 glycosyl transferase WecB/TagA/CpsF [Treponema brennaborense DSM 12168]
MATKRISLLRIPIDILPPEQVEQEILELVEKPGTKQIIFLSVWGLLKARSNAKFRECVNNADLILPVSKSLLHGASFLKLAVPVRYDPFSAVISFLNALDSRYKSVYLFGDRKKTLSKAEHNVRMTFPGLHVIGRYVGYYPKHVEPDIVSAIYKASPSLVLISDGVSEKDCWPYHRRNRFSSSTFVYYRDMIGIFAKRVKHVSPKIFDKGLEIWGEILHNPLKIFLVFPFFWYIIVLVWYKIIKPDQ